MIFAAGPPRLAKPPGPRPCLDFGFQYTLIRNNWSKKIGGHGDPAYVFEDGTKLKVPSEVERPLSGAPRLSRHPRPGPCVDFGFQYTLIRNNRSKKFGDRILGIAWLKFDVTPLFITEYL